MHGLPDIATVELSRTRLKLRDDLRFQPQVYAGETWYHLEVTTTGEFFRIGFPEYTFVSLLDGRTSFAEALAITAQTLQSKALTQAQALSVYTWLLDNGLASFADTETASSGATSAARATWKSDRLWKKLNPFWIRIPFGNPETILRALQPGVGWIFSVPAMVMSLLLMFVATLLLMSNWSQFQSASSSVISSSNWLWLLGAWAGLKVVHETAHGLVCIRHGGTVRETGIIFAFFTPLAYVDASSGWAFRSRWHRIHTSMAGMYIELVIASISMVCWTWADSALIRHWLQNLIVMASLSTLLFNLNPLMRFDGYFILSDLLYLPNLASQSTDAIRDVVRRLVFGESSTRPQIIGYRRSILLAYGIASLAWRLTVSVSLIIAASVLLKGAGLLLALVGVLLWFAKPLLTFLKQCRQMWHQSPEQLLRGSLITIVAFASICGLGFGLPAPVMTTAPGVVEFTEGEVVRAITPGFVQELHIQSGHPVKAGDLLVTLQNDDVTARYSDLQQHVAQEELRLQTASRDHDSAALSIAQGNLDSLHRQLEECQKEVDGLQIRASRNGQVVSSDLHRLKGTFASAGMELMSIGRPGEKELQLSVGQRELPVAMTLVGRPVRVRVGTRASLHGVLQRVNPRASRSIPHPALAAVNGGELDVLQDQSPEQDSKESKLRLTEHRFNAIVTLDPADAQQVLCGECGSASLGMQSLSFGKWAWRSCHDWLEQQLTRAVQSEK